MKSNTILTALLPAAAVTAALLAGGCNGDGDDVDSLAETEATVDAGLNAGHMRGVPALTQQRILDDLDGKQIAGPVDIQATAEGTFYDVSYYATAGDDDVKSRLYDRQGNVVDSSDRRSAAARDREDAAGRPIRQNRESVNDAPDRPEEFYELEDQDENDAFELVD